MRFFRLFGAGFRALPQVLPMLRDRRVPLLLKVAAVASAFLIISPIDVFGDIPVLGTIDDAALLMMAATIFVRLAKGHIRSLPG